MFAEKNYNSIVPEMIPTEEDYTLLALCTRELKSYVDSIEKGKLRDGIRHILALSKHGNHYMQSTQPWVLLKGNDSDKYVLNMFCFSRYVKIVTVIKYIFLI